jgi:transposase
MWISQLKSGQEMSKKQSSRRRGPQQLFYTEAFKQKIVHEVLSGKLNKHQASKIYGIKGNATILCWIRESQQGANNESAATTIANFADMKEDIQKKKLLEENKELKELLRVAELRADLWQHAIEIAEQKLNIAIKKKYGAQPLAVSKNKDGKKK